MLRRDHYLVEIRRLGEGSVGFLVEFDDESWRSSFFQ
jgi:hypothetical protein